MTTYVYETMPTDDRTETKFYEFQQSMKDAPLTEHPETGEPIRRIILGGYGTLTKQEPGSSDHCGPSCCC